MSAMHLATVPNGTRCGQGDMSTHDGERVTCRRCRHNMTLDAFEAEEREWATRFLIQRRSAAQRVGLGDIFAFAESLGDDPTSHMLVGIVGALANGLDEMGYRPAT